MLIDTKNMVSITEANKNFSKVAKMVDENGTAVILRNNVPKYVLIEFEALESQEVAPHDKVKSVTTSILNKHIQAFEELAK